MPLNVRTDLNFIIVERVAISKLPNSYWTVEAKAIRDKKKLKILSIKKRIFVQIMAGVGN